MTATPASAPFHGWRMVALAFVAYNTGLTVVMNSFGPAMPILERELGVSRASISMAFGLFMLAQGAFAPVVGNLAQRVNLRTLMMVGCACNALGFGLLAFARSLLEVFLVYGAVIGPGSCLLAVVAAPTLVSRWFEHDRGKALAIGLLQITALVNAPIAAWLLASGGRSLMCFVFAGLYVVLIPVMSLVIDWPKSVGQSPRQAPTAEISTAPSAPAKTSREILSDSRFWLINITVGLYTASGVTLSSHGPAMAVAKGAELTIAATLLSAMGAGTLIGAFAFGWLMDKIGPFRALILAVAVTGFLWFVLAIAPSIPVMALIAFCMGIVVGPTPAIQSACLSEVFGAASFGRVIGYAFFVKLPFLVGPAPIAGRLYDLLGDYRMVCLAAAALEATAVLLAVALLIVHHRKIASQRRTADVQSAV